MKRKNTLYLIVIFFIIAIFFRPVIFQNRIPVPTDTLVNLFNPFRDFYSREYPRGVPYKNPIVSDPVIQQIPWRTLSLEVLKRFELPLWNPYQMAGYPLLGNIQSAPFYPLNILFFFLPFIPAWTLFIFLQPILAGIFMYFYLKNRELSAEASLFGALAFSLSGFFVAWLEWGTIVHTALWVPLTLLAVDKVVKTQRFTWFVLLGVSIVSSFLAGHLQTFIYSLVILITYFIWQYANTLRNRRLLISFLITIGVVLLVVLPILLPQLNLITLSARDVDQNWQKLGWFIPLAQLMQFFAPDFFGNPATGNYWGVFNYGEFIGYIGIAPLLFAFIALFSERRKEVLLWSGIAFIAILMASQNPLSELPYRLSIPFFSSTQPTRLLFIVDVALVILAAIGFDTIQQFKKKISLSRLLEVIGGTAIIVYGFIFLSSRNFDPVNFAVSRHNLIVPTILFCVSSATILFSHFLPRKKVLFPVLIIFITCLDLLFFAGKYTPFASKDYFYPTTKVMQFLIDKAGYDRIMTTSRQILSPNISTMYHLQSIDGYDPLYLMRYGQLMSAVERGKPDISSPFGFNRIIVPTTYASRVINLLGVKYVLSLTDRESPQLKKVFQEGETRVYENQGRLPRAFFVNTIIPVQNEKAAITKLFDPTIDLLNTAIVEKSPVKTEFASGNASIITYSENRVILKVITAGEAFLVLTDSYYPTWEVSIDNNPSEIFITDFNFRGVVVPQGIHTVEFKDTLL